MKGRHLLLLLVWMFLNVVSVQSQQYEIERQVIGSLGQVFDSSGYYLSATVGEFAVKCRSLFAQDVTEGFQQPFLDFAPQQESDEAIRVFPNPAKDVLFIESDYTENLIIDIHTITGSILNTYTFYSDENNSKSSINFSDFASGLYIVIVSNASGEINKLTKIIKIQ